MNVAASLVLLILLFAGTSSAQVVGTRPVEQERESLFLFEVKLIDEFIERFNNDPSSYIRQRSRVAFGTDSFITRRKLLRSLADKKRSWSQDTASFFAQVADASNPVLLNFTDSNWYAEAMCIFRYNGKDAEVPVVLHIKTSEKGSKWMIAGIGNSEIFSGKLPEGTSKSAAGKATGDFIPTSSHGTGFVVFNNVFSGKMHPADYFEPAALTPGAHYFIQLILQHKISFRYVKHTRFHFFQVKGWIFTVEQFKRKEANNGWLMSSLQQAAGEEKIKVLKALLNQ